MVRAQESILRFAIDPTELIVCAGESVAFRLRVQNGSIYEADDVTVQLKDEEAAFSLRSIPASLKQLPPFGEGNFDLALSIQEGTSSGLYQPSLEVVYTYCADDVCFQIVDLFSLQVQVTKEVVSPPPKSTRRSAVWKWLFPTFGAILLAGAMLLWRLSGLAAPLHGVLVLLIGGGLAYGVALHQHQQAQGIAAVLCTSCVGIEEARSEKPTLTGETLAALATLDQRVEMIVFYAPWCHSCPYAEAMVEMMASRSNRITYRFVNVEQDRDLARAHGVIRSGRTVVPAVLRVDTGEVIFGVEHLEARLLQLLGVAR